MTVLVDEVLSLLKKRIIAGLEIHSTNGNPNQEQKAAIEEAVSAVTPSHVTFDDVRVALDGWTREEIESGEISHEDIAKAACAVLLDRIACAELEEEWGGDVTDGASYIVYF